MAKPTTKKAPAKKAAAPKPVNKKASVALRTVGVRAANHRKAREATRKARNELDQSMLSAKRAGATYREIADSAGVSTAWVQASLERAGYTTEAR